MMYVIASEYIECVLFASPNGIAMDSKLFKGTDPYIMTLPLGRNIIRHAMVDGVQEMGRDMCVGCV